jgi:hypothetical protein
LCRLNDTEKGLVPSGALFNYKEVQLFKAIAAPSQLSLDEARLLADLVRNSDPQRPIIEIGTLFGWSTRVMAVAKPKEQELITVDNYSWNPHGMSSDAHYRATRMALSDAIANHNIRQVRMSKDEFYAQYSGPTPSLFFCDADHSYEATLADLKWARSRGADVICGDDYSPEQFPGVVRAVEEMGGARQLVEGFFVL